MEVIIVAIGVIRGSPGMQRGEIKPREGLKDGMKTAEYL